MGLLRDKYPWEGLSCPIVFSSIGAKSLALCCVLTISSQKKKCMSVQNLVWYSQINSRESILHRPCMKNFETIHIGWVMHWIAVRPSGRMIFSCPVTISQWIARIGGVRHQGTIREHVGIVARILCWSTRVNWAEWNDKFGIKTVFIVAKQSKSVSWHGPPDHLGLMEIFVAIEPPKESLILHQPYIDVDLIVTVISSKNWMRGME